MYQKVEQLEHNSARAVEISNLKNGTAEISNLRICTVEISNLRTGTAEISNLKYLLDSRSGPKRIHSQ
jgi:hypothetical protein